MTSSAFLKYTLFVLMIGFTAHLTGLLFILDGSVYTTISNLGLFLPALILCIGDRGLRNSFIQKHYRPVLLLLAFSMLMALLNPNATISAFTQFKTVLYIALYLGTIHILAREGLLEKCLTFTFVVAGLFAIAGLLIHSIQQEQNILFSGKRLFSMGYGGYADFKNPIIAALYFGFFGIYGFHLLLTKALGLWSRVLFAACVLGLSMYVFCTLSRAVWLGYGLAICTTILFHHNSRSRKWLYLAAVLFLGAAAWLWPILLHQQNRGFSLRDHIWAGWLNRLGDFWLFGAGAGRDFDFCIAGTRCFSQAHNLFLQFFYEFGIMGAALIILAVIHACKCAIDKKTWARPLGSVGLPLLIFGVTTALFDYHTVYNRPGVYWIVFWLPIGIILSQKVVLGAQYRASAHAH
jgi:O-antigen ligase